MSDLSFDVPKVRKRFEETLGCGFILNIIAIVAISIGLAGIITHFVGRELKNDLQLVFGGLGFLIFSFGFWNKFEKRARDAFEAQIRQSGSLDQPSSSETTDETTKPSESTDV
jgi:hypothetical protein